ncbi:MAG: hypothetical protein PUK40_01580 [Actinomycetaceae bacterium]|nr:hypothetical protein [Arcanobacterium sp.]MDD7504634.1 hypothetical protein [Actinomycetaceae bacterium]MDY6143050.1 hypothetical protein [Arcanobacterium sp.]
MSPPVQTDPKQKFLTYYRYALWALIIIVNLLLHALGVHYTAMIFIANVMFFTMQGEPWRKYWEVLVGGAVGIFATYAMLRSIMWLTPYVGELIAFVIPLAIILFVLIVLHPKVPVLFNNVGFAYLLACTINMEAFMMHFWAHVITFVIGTAVLNAVCIFMMKPVAALAKPRNSSGASPAS